MPQAHASWENLAATMQAARHGGRLEAMAEIMFPPLRRLTRHVTGMWGVGGALPGTAQTTDDSAWAPELHVTPSSNIQNASLSLHVTTMSERGAFRGRGGGRGGDRGGRGGGRGGAQAGGAGGHAERPKKENILDLSKYMDKQITVKFSGGREGTHLGAVESMKVWARASQANLLQSLARSKATTSS
jgi:hypothetical protein